MDDVYTVEDQTEEIVQEVQTEEPVKEDREVSSKHKRRTEKLQKARGKKRHSIRVTLILLVM